MIGLPSLDETTAFGPLETTVAETGNSPNESGNKVDVNPGTLPLDQRDVVNLADVTRDRGHRDQPSDRAGLV